MVKKKKESNWKRNLWIWTGINIVWWVASIGLSGHIDVNPWLNDGQEVLVNTLVWLIGCGIVFQITIEKEEK